MKKSNLLRSLVADKGTLLVPHIDAYQARGKFPSKWWINIDNVKTERDHGEAKIRFSASSDALATEEALFNKLTEPQPEEIITAQLRRTFDVGTFWHVYLQNILFDMGFIEVEGIEQYIIHKIERPEGIAYGSGLGDLVGVNIPGNGSWLVDIKSMNENSFEDLPSYIMDKYTAQIRLYGDWFRYEKLMILAVNKNTSELKEIVVQQDPVFLEGVYNKWIAVMNRLENI